MKIEIRTHGIELSSPLEAYIRRRMKLSLRRFQGRLGRIVIRLRDVNGPRGGVDKRFRVSVRLAPKGKVRLQQTGSDVYQAVQNASTRLGHLLSHELKRRRESRRGRESVRRPPKSRSRIR
ncbi:MAG: HPF/RaiA family ribosome-associated protein [Candidatus Acidiferrales bacterium]